MKRKTLVKKVASVLLCLMVVLTYTTGFHGALMASAEEGNISNSENEQNVVNEPADDGSFGENSPIEAPPDDGGMLPDDDMENTDCAVISSWTWVDDDELLIYDEEAQGWYLETATDEETPITAELLEGCFPQSIKAVLADGTEEELEITWDFSPLGEGVTEGDHTVQASLPEGYILAEDVEALSVTIKLDDSGLLEEEETAGDFTVAGGKLGEDYTFSGTTLTVISDTPLVIKNTASNFTNHNIEIKEGIHAKITLAGVKIHMNTTGGADTSPINMLGAGTWCDLTLQKGSVNTLNATKLYAAALHCSGFYFSY